MSLNDQITKKRLIIGVVVAIVLVVSLIAAWRFYTNGKTKLVINVAPSDAQITLNESFVKAGTSYIRPGEYTITIKRDGFNTITEAISTKSNETYVVSKLLIANSEAGTAYERKHIEEFNKIADLIDDENYAHSIYFNKEWASRNYPLLTLLPIDVYPLFTIQYGQSEKYPDDASKKAVYIYNSGPSERQSALERIYGAGYDPSDYEIIFKDYSSSNEYLTDTNSDLDYEPDIFEGQ